MTLERWAIAFLFLCNFTVISAILYLCAWAWFTTRPIGTKSVLIGAHCFWLHPWFVALAWWRMYGFPWDPRLWVAFMVHDLGYWGKPNMDGPEGEAHVVRGALIMDRWFGAEWHDLCLYHSRYYAKKDGVPPSRLCYPDKLSFVITPGWLYKFCVNLTGEWREYAAAHNHEVRHNAVTLDQWYYPSREYVRQWVIKFQSGQEQDTWTQPKPTTVGQPQ